MLMVVEYRKRKREIEEEEVRFERDFFIGQPALYYEWKEKEKEEQSSGNGGVTWMTPESVEEAEELLSVFADIDQQLKQEASNPQDQEFTSQMGLMSLFDGINVDEIGD